MPDDKTPFMDSPWVQLGVPLAAVAASAIAPRHAGRAASMGLDAFQGINQYRYGQKRLRQVMGEQEDEKRATESLQNSWNDYEKGEAPHEEVAEGPAPAGGDVPRADMNAKTEALEQGTVPKPTFQFKPGQRQELEVILATNGRKAAGARQAAMMQDYFKAQEPKEHKFDFHATESEYGDRVMSKYDTDPTTGVTTQSQFLEAGPKPREYNTFAEGAMSDDPAIRERAAAGFAGERRAAAQAAAAGRAPKEPRPQGEQLLEQAITAYTTKNPDASPGERAQAAGLMKANINVEDLDRISDTLGAGDPRSLIKFNDAVGRGGAPVRSYLLARTLRKYPDFDPAGVDRKITMMKQYEDPASRPGRSVQAFGTWLQHAGQAVDIVKKYEESGIPILNIPLNKLRTEFAGDPDVLNMLAAINPVKYEYATFMNGGYALTDHDKQNVDNLLPANATVGQMLSVIGQMGHTAEARAGEMNSFYKRSIGTDIPNMFSPEALAAAQKIGLNLGGAKPREKPREPGVGEEGFDPRSALQKKSGGQKMFAKNPETGERIMSSDGGQTWAPAP